MAKKKVILSQKEQIILLIEKEIKIWKRICGNADIFRIIQTLKRLKTNIESEVLDV